MSSLSQFGGNHVVTSIVNGDAAGGVQKSLTNASQFSLTTLSGALTANTLATALTLTGRGQLNFAAVAAVDATSRTMRIKVTIDGTSVFDATSATCTTTANGIVAVGHLLYSSSDTVPVFQPIPYHSSCLVEIASSLSETDKIRSHVNYEVWQ